MDANNIAHHESLLELSCFTGDNLPACRVDFLGIHTLAEFERGMPGVEADPPVQFQQPPRPAFDEEYFEWLDVIAAVKAARGQFNMIELGAGYSRWLVRAVKVLEQLNPMPYKLVAVEAEPSHFQFSKRHMQLNGIDPEQHRLIEAAVNASGDKTRFTMGKADGWYGQAMFAPRKRSLLTRVANWLGYKPPEMKGVSVVWVEAVTLNSLLAQLPHVDLLDLDIQGAEAEVLEASIEALKRKVWRVHIGTHSPKIEQQLRALFGQAGWVKINDYACQRSQASPYGEIHFGDGVQTWLNPARPEA